MQWKVTNALSRDVERQQLNKILADIRLAMNSVESKAAEPTDDVRAIVGSMVEGNSEQGLSVTYNAPDGVLDFAVNNFIIHLSGDVTGQGTVSSLRDVTISTKLDPDKVGIPDAPVDNHAYWRLNGAWDQVADSILELGQLRDVGFLSQSYDSDEGEVLWAVRQFEAVSGELVITNPAGETGNPIYGLADLADSGVGTSPVQLFTRDSKGRVEGTEDASTDDLPEGVANLYFTEERAQDAVGAILGTTDDVALAYDDSTPAVTATLPSKGQPDGLATLDGDGKLVATQLPALAITETFVVADEAAMLALVAEQGDVAVRTDEEKTYILTADPASTLSNWQELLFPTSAGGTVSSVGSGTGLTGGPITSTGTLSLNSASIASLALADSATQPGDLATVATTGDYDDLSNLPTLGTAAATDSTDYATAAQGTTADSAVQPGDNVSDLVNDAGYLTSLAGSVPTTRVISTTAPLTGGGDLSADRTLAISAATTGAAGSMSAADKTKLNGIATGATAYTDTLARAAVIASSITNGDTTHSPSGDAVFDALALKANNSNVVHTTGNESIAGLKTFTDSIGVGVAPDVPLLINSDANVLAAGTPVLRIEGDGNKERIELKSGTAGDPTIHGYSASGTLAAPTATANGEVLLQLNAGGHDGSAWVAARAFLRAYTTETWTASGNGTRWNFALTPAGSTSAASVLDLYGSGEVVVGTTSGGGVLSVLRPGTSSAGSSFQFSSPAAVPGLVAFTGTTSRTDVRFGVNILQLAVGASASTPAIQAEVTTTSFRPGSDNNISAGESGRRWSVVYAATGAINTSDAREKTTIAPLSDAEVAFARDLAGEIGTYQWLASITEKGEENARHHVGVTVQRCIELAQVHGLDPFRYGFICYDQWIETPELRDAETGEVSQEYSPAGDRYSLRPDQLNLFIAKGFEARLKALENAVGV
jgi:hypothetical protein